MVAWLAPPRQASIPYRVLDLAGGTGDIATRIVHASAGASVVVGDINASMLAEGARRAEKAALADRLSFVEANAEEMPFANGDFAAVTIAFGIRNVPRIDLALREIHRVLKPGGRFLCLEFSTVDVAGLEEFVRARVARYKVPREWHVEQVLPRNPSGKILKRDIRDAFLARSGH